MATSDLRDEGRFQGKGSDTTKSSLKRFSLRSGDIRQLYDAARSLGGMGGAPYLNRLFDAETALANGRLDRAHEILAMTRQEFEKSHTRILRFQPKDEPDSPQAGKEQARLLGRKQQVEEMLSQFDAYVAVVERMADRAERKDAQTEPAESPPTPRHEESELPAGFAEAFANEATTEGQFSVVQRHFEVTAVESPENVARGGLYFLRTRASGYVLRIEGTALESNFAELTDAMTRQSVRPQPIGALVDQGKKGKFFSLVPRAQVAPRENVERHDSRDSLPVDPLEANNTLLDKQLFNVLMTAVRNSGLDVSTELIVQVRDNEFRKGEYLDAFEKLNQLSTRYDVAAARRKDDLRRHDQFLASGQSGLSLREVEEAKLKNAQERTRLEHASHRFGLVVEPLRILSRGVKP